MLSLRHHPAATMFAVLATVAACDVSPFDEATAPLSVAGDQADRACHVMLTSLQLREIGTPGNYMTDCDLDATSCSHRLVWFAEGRLSPSLVQAGGVPALLYRSTDDPTAWIETSAAMSLDPFDGSAHFEARMIALRPGSDDGTQGAELIPLARLPGGGRLFDHNTYPGPFENYRIGTPPEGTLQDTSSSDAARWSYRRSTPCDH